MSKETISQTEGLCKEVANCIRNAYDRGYKQGVNDGSLDVKMRVDGAYEKGLNDAWELARDVIRAAKRGISYMSRDNVRYTIADDVILNISVDDILEVYKRYNQKDND